MKTADNSLEIGAILDNRYRIDGVLGIGGFGVTYKAHDDTLDCTVVIKEYLPEECGARDSDTLTVIPRTNREDDYQYGLEKYLEEARTLAKFKHPNIVRVSNFLKTNGTAYFVMDYDEGEDLSVWLKKHDNINEDIILKIITPILEGLAEVHKTGLLHRDIKPGNIYMRKQGGAMLIDFGAARQALGEQSKSISAIISQGYAPPEQYTTRGKQGPFTDLYAIGATLYKLITGKAPLESADRAHDLLGGEPDPLIPATEAGKGKVSDWLLQLTDQMLNINAKDRPQNAEAVLEAIKNKTTAVGCAVRTETPAEPDNKTRVVKSAERFGKKSEKVQPGLNPERKQKSDVRSMPYGKIVSVLLVIAALLAGGLYVGNESGSADNQSRESHVLNLNKNKYDALSESVSDKNNYAAKDISSLQDSEIAKKERIKIEKENIQSENTEAENRKIQAELSSDSYLLLNFNDDVILADKNIDKKLSPGSITKVMTAYVVFKEIEAGRLGLDDVVSVSEEAWRMSGSRMFLSMDKKVSVKDLLKGLIVQSANDASVALAEHIAGSEAAFTNYMNKNAAALGMTDTHYMNSTGLPDSKHKTTARDIATLAKSLILNFPQHYKFYAEKEMTYNDIKQYNRNKLLWRVKAVDGLKTSHTESGGYSLVVSAKKGGTRLIAVVLGAESSNLIFSDGEKLIDHGFNALN